MIGRPYPQTVQEEESLLREKPWLKPADNQPRSLGEVIVRIDRHLGGQPEPLPDGFMERLAVTMRSWNDA